MGMIRSLQTNYLGFRFRSRVEARWCVFFKKMGIEFEYETQGFDLGSAGRYLPDFWLPQVKMWAEVKPLAFTPEEYAKAKALYVFTGYPVLMLIGPPDFKEYSALETLGPEDKLTPVPYSLTSEYLFDESRFFCMGYPEPGDMAYWQDDYIHAVNASRAERFDRGRG
jgi:hypothetical protein